MMWHACRYTLGTILSFYNKLLVGKDSKIFNEEPFPGGSNARRYSDGPAVRSLHMGYAAAAPLFMAGMQFAMQHMLARLVFSTGLIKRTADNLSWQEWLKCGKDKGVRGWKRQWAKRFTKVCPGQG